MNLRRSLRLRLLLGGALWIAIALVISWGFIFATFASLIDNDRRADLQASLERLVAAIDPEGTDPIGQGPLADPRYDTPLSGVYWQVQDLGTGDIASSRSLWDERLPIGPIGDGHAALSQVTVPDGPSLIVLTQTIRMSRADGSERQFQVSVAEERGTEDDPVMRFGATLGVFLLIIAVTLFVAAVVQVQVGLRPLATLQQAILAVRRGDADRMPGANTVELQPVATQINELLAAQETTVNFVRERAADLAHGLKTPLAVLGAISDRLREEGDVANAETLRLLTDQMNERIDYQLRIARLRFRTRAQGVSASANDAVLRCIAVLRKGHDGERINWIINLEDRLDVDIDRHDLMELVGIVLDNADKWARSRVAIHGARHGDEIKLTVEDDGEGIDDEQITHVGRRGVRLDEQTNGHGMGLAIAFEIARLNGGRIDLERSAMGGLAVGMRLVAKGRAPQGTLSTAHQA